MKQIEQTITSIEVAEMIGKSHCDLLKNIRRYTSQLGEGKNPSTSQLGEGKIDCSDFWVTSQYQSDQGKTLPCYQVTKKGCEFIAHKLTGIKGTKFTATYINRFHEMEDTLKGAELLQIQELSQRIKDLEILVLNITQKQNLLEQRNMASNGSNPFGSRSTAELEERKKGLYDLTSKVAELCEMSHARVLHYLYQAMEERLSLTLNSYKSVYISETGNTGASMVEAISSNNRLYETAVEMCKEVIERKQIFG